MDITNSNFRARLPEIEAAIDSSIFLAIDGEFTGLNTDKGNSPFDLPAERYTEVASLLSPPYFIVTYRSKTVSPNSF